MIKRPRDIFKKEYLSGKECGRAFMSDFLCRKMKKKDLYTKEEKAEINRRLIPTSTDKKTFDSYLLADKWLSEAWQIFSLRAVDIDRMTFLQMCFILPFQREILRLGRVPYIIHKGEIIEYPKLHPIDELNIKCAGVAEIVKEGSHTSEMIKASLEREPFSNLKKLYAGEHITFFGICEGIEKRLYEAIAINEAIKLVAEYFKEPDIECMMGETKSATNNLEAMNSALKEIHQSLTHFGLEELDKRFEKDCWQIDTSIKIPEERINTARATLQKERYFSEALGDCIFNILSAKE